MNSVNVDNVKEDTTFIVFFWGGGGVVRRRGNYTFTWHLTELTERAVAIEVLTLF